MEIRVVATGHPRQACSEHRPASRTDRRSPPGPPDRVRAGRGLPRVAWRHHRSPTSRTGTPWPGRGSARSSSKSFSSRVRDSVDVVPALSPDTRSVTGYSALSPGTRSWHRSRVPPRRPPSRRGRCNGYANSAAPGRIHAKNLAAGRRGTGTAFALLVGSATKIPGLGRLSENRPRAESARPGGGKKSDVRQISARREAMPTRSPPSIRV